MSGMVHDVAAFYAKFGLPLPQSPTQLTQERLTFRFTRIVEEAAEFCQSARKGDLEGAAQELVDVIYFAIGTALEMGFPLDAVWNCVHTANMQKELPKGKSARYGEKHDVVKGASWRSPADDIKRIFHNRALKPLAPPIQELVRLSGSAETFSKAPRASLDSTMLRIAEVLATRAACSKRQVGCVLTDAHGRIVGSGYNGRAHGQSNCEGVNICAACEGVHAETNALQSAAWGSKPETCYVTVAPCWHCVKQLANSSVHRIVTQSMETWESRANNLWCDKLGRSIQLQEKLA